MECSFRDTVVFITSQDSSCRPFPLNVILAFTSCRRFYALELSCPFLPAAMDLSQSLLSSQCDLCKADIPTPAKDLPLTPPSTETSTPYQTSTHCPPQHSDLKYVDHRLWSGSQRHHTRRFSYENPTWPDEERYLPDEPLLPYHTQDDDATIVSNSTRARSRSSQTTLCASLDPAEQTYSTWHRTPLAVAAFSPLSQYPYDKVLPPTPPTSRLHSPSSSRYFEDLPMRSRKCSLTGSSISSPVCTTQASSPLRNTPTHDLLPSVGDRVQSWPTYVPQREAPKPPVMEEKSVWESDSEGEEGPFRQRISNPLRALLCAGKKPRRRKPRRKSA